MNLVALFVLLLFDYCEGFIDGAVNAVAGAGKTAVKGTVDLGNTIGNGFMSMFDFGPSPDAEDYHSSDKEVIGLKQRLLSDANPRGIRARLKNETVEIPAAATDVVKLAKAVQNLSAGSAKFTAVLDGVSEQYPEIIRLLKEYRNSLEGNKTAIDKHIQNFAIENTASLFKAIAENPNVQQKVFEKFNQGVSTMYHSLDRQMKTVERNFNSTGKQTMKSLKDIMLMQNKTMKNLDSRMKSDDFIFRQKLNRKAVPDMVLSEYIASSNLAKLRKAVLDSIDNFTGTILTSIQRQADSYLDTQGDKVVEQAKKLIDKGASNLRRQLLLLQNAISRQARITAQQFDKNITSLSTSLDGGTVSVANNRKAALNELSKTVDAAIGVVNDFQHNVMATSNDLSNMLTVGGVNMDAIDNQNKLAREEIENEFDSKQKGISSSDVLSKNQNGMTTLQGGISSAFAQGKSEASGMSNYVQAKIAAGLSDSEDIAAQIAHEVEGVESSQSEIVNGQLATGIGLATNRVGDFRKGRVSSTTDFASNLQARIDSNEADIDEAMSDSVSSAEKSTENSKSLVMGKLSDLNSRISQNQDQLMQRQASGRSNWVKALTSSQSELNNNVQSLSAVEALVRSLGSGSLPQLDSQNEDRINSALSQLTELRRLGSSSGDSVQTSGNEFLSKLLSSVPQTTTSLSATNTTALDKQVTNLKTVSTNYKGKMAEFESNMNKQFQDINAQYTAVDRQVTTGPASKAIGTIVAHQQSVLAKAGREAVRAIYNSSSPESVQGTIAQYVSKNPRFDIDRYLGYLLHDDRSTGFPAMYGLLSEKLSELSSTGVTAESGLSSFFNYLENLKSSIAKKLTEVPPSELKQLQDLIDFRQATLDEVDTSKMGLNGSIVEQFRLINETIENKTTNFYKQFQMASIFADSLVQGFRDYIDKMISYEKLSEEQRNAAQAQLIATIQASSNSTGIQSALSKMNSSEIDRINSLVAQASDTSDQSAAGIEKRRAANQALIDAMGTQIASDMMKRYSGLQANSIALAKSLQTASDDYASNREASIAAAQLGVDGINSQTTLFSSIADDSIADQKARANELGKAIDSLLSNSTFLQNISSEEFGKILQSVQESDQLNYKQLNGYKSASSEQVATLDGVVRDFSFLVEQEINRTREFLDALSLNFTDISKKTSVVSDSVMSDIKSNLSGVSERVDATKTTLNSDILSVGPIQEGVEGRLGQLMDNENKFADNTQSQLRQLVTRVDALDSDVAMARDKDMRRLRRALTQMTEDFRNKAIQMQSENVVGGFLETESSRDIKSDIGRRMDVLRKYARV